VGHRTRETFPGLENRETWGTLHCVLVSKSLIHLPSIALIVVAE